MNKMKKHIVLKQIKYSSSNKKCVQKMFLLRKLMNEKNPRGKCLFLHFLIGFSFFKSKKNSIWSAVSALVRHRYYKIVYVSILPRHKKEQQKKRKVMEKLLVF